MICPKCKTISSTNAKFCSECGADVSYLSGISELNINAAENKAYEDKRDSPQSLIGGEQTILPRTLSRKPSPIQVQGPINSRYELLEQIGKGGFAVVWKARDIKLGRIVAVKFLKSRNSGSDYVQKVIAERFKREAQSIAKLNHLNIVTVYDHECDDENVFIVMEYIDGGSLRDYLNSVGGALPTATAIQIAIGVAQGLSYAHRLNLVHRDIKPANILLVRNNMSDSEEVQLIPKIVDFGLARQGSDSDLSVSGFGLGTPFYVAPEQRRDAKNVNHTADIYSLGKTLYEMVTGEIPDSIDPDVIPSASGLAKVIIKSIKPNPSDRYFSTDEFIAALSSVEEGKGTEKASLTAGKNVIRYDLCPACGMEDVAELRFCQGCGAGLVRLCPECGQELRVQMLYCGSCGTDINAFQQAKDSVDRMKRFLAEKKFSRVLKEYESVAVGDFNSNNPNAKELIRILKSLEESAQIGENNKKILRQEIGEVWKSRYFDQLENLLDLYVEESGELEDDLQHLRNRIQPLRKLETLNEYSATLAKMIDRRSWSLVKKSLDEEPPLPEVSHPDDEKALEEVRSTIEELRVKVSRVIFEEQCLETEQIHEGISSAMELGDWAASWGLTVSLPVTRFPELLSEQHLACLSAARDDILALGEEIAVRWVDEQANVALTSAQNGEWDKADQELNQILKLPCNASICELKYQETSEAIRDIKISQLRNSMFEFLNARQWDKAIGTASALISLCPDDSDAVMVQRESLAGKKVDSEIDSIGVFYHTGKYAACIARCKSLMERVDGNYEVSTSWYRGNLQGLLKSSITKAQHQDESLAEIDRYLEAGNWDKAIESSQQLVNLYSWMEGAKARLSNAVNGKRRAFRKKILLTSASSLAVLVILTFFSFSIYYIRNVAAFKSAVRSDDTKAALLLVQKIGNIHSPALHYQEALNIRQETRNSIPEVPHEESVMQYCHAWQTAMQVEADANRLLVDRKFKHAIEKYSQLPQLYQDTSHWIANYGSAVASYEENYREMDNLFNRLDSNMERLYEESWRKATAEVSRVKAMASTPAEISKQVILIKNAIAKLKSLEKELAAVLQKEHQDFAEAKNIFISQLDNRESFLKNYAGDLWEKIQTEINNAEDNQGKPIGTNSYKEACRLLGDAISHANQEWDKVKKNKLRELSEKISNCEKLFQEALASSSKSRQGLNKSQECLERLAEIKTDEAYAELAQSEKTGIQSLEKKCTDFHATTYRGPEVNEKFWKVPGFDMVLVWVDKLDAWVCQTEVSNRDYRERVPAHNSREWGAYSLNSDDQPAVMLLFKDASLYAEKLTLSEKQAHRIPDGYQYRLLTRQEWIVCAQCGTNWKFPWGNEMPPACNNYADSSFRAYSKVYGVAEYNDQFVVSSPVYAGFTNNWSICNMGGNVRELVTCSETLSPLICDGSWRTYEPGKMECTYSEPVNLEHRFLDTGFRLILGKSLK